MREGCWTYHCERYASGALFELSEVLALNAAELQVPPWILTVLSLVMASQIEKHRYISGIHYPILPTVQTDV